MQIIILITCILLCIIVIIKIIMRYTVGSESFINEHFVITDEIKNKYNEYKTNIDTALIENKPITDTELNKTLGNFTRIIEYIKNDKKRNINMIDEQINSITTKINELKGLNDKAKIPEIKELTDFKNNLINEKNSYNSKAYTDFIKSVISDEKKYKEIINLKKEYEITQEDKTNYIIKIDDTIKAINSPSLSLKEKTDAINNFRDYGNKYITTIDKKINDLTTLINGIDRLKPVQRLIATPKRDLLNNIRILTTNNKININNDINTQIQFFNNLLKEITNTTSSTTKIPQIITTSPKIQTTSQIIQKNNSEVSKPAVGDKIGILPTYDALKYLNKDTFDITPRTGLYLINKKNLALSVYDIATNNVTDIDICKDLPISALYGPNSTCTNKNIAFYLKQLNEVITNTKYFSTMYAPNRIFTMNIENNAFRYNIYDNDFTNIRTGTFSQYKPTLKAGSRYYTKFSNLNNIYNVSSYKSNIVLFSTSEAGTFIFIIPISQLEQTDIDIIPILAPTAFQLPGNIRLENPGIITFNDKLYLIGGAYGNTNNQGTIIYNKMLILTDDINFNTSTNTLGIKWMQKDMRTGDTPKKVGVINTTPFIYNNELYITGLEINDSEDYTDTQQNETLRLLTNKPTIPQTRQNYIYKYKEDTNVFIERNNFTQKNLCVSETINTQRGKQIRTVCYSENQIIIPIF